MDDYYHSWDKFNYVSIDLEGAGPGPLFGKEIISIGLVDITKGQVTNNFFYSLIKPSQPINYGSWSVHGLTNADLKDKPYFEAVKGKILKFLEGKILIAHSASVEWGVMSPKFPTLKPPFVLDTLKLSKRFLPNGKYSLPSVLEKLGLTSPSFMHHNSLDDAKGAALIFTTLLKDQKLTLKELATICAIYPSANSLSNQQSLF